MTPNEESGYALLAVLTRIADALDAIHGTLAEAAACACVSDAVMSGRVAVEHKPVGNAAAMYDALVKIAHYCDDKDGMDDPYCADGHILSDIARAALSEPARNCDHADYLERFKCFCRGRNCQVCKYEVDRADCYAAFLLDRAEEGGKQ